MKPISTVKIVLLAFIFFPAFIYGQGTLRGTVTDSITGDPLVGANVFITGTSLGDAVDIEGHYQVNGIKAGNCSVRISYVGFKPKDIEVTIENGKTKELNFRLIPDVVMGEEVIITAQAMGQVAAINQQRSSNTIVNVVSEEKIKELPDANAAEAIGRLPGVSLLRSGGEANKVILRGLSDKYTNVTIDGIKIAGTDSSARGLDLSTIAQSSLAGIELFKALTPDKDGDAIAGTINLVTRNAPKTREIRAEMKGGYNDLMSSAKQYDFYLHYGERYFDDFLGMQISGNIENRIRSNETIDQDLDQNGNNQHDYFINDFTLQYSNEIRKRNGLSGIFDIPTPDEGTLKLSLVYSGTNRNYLTALRDYPNGGGQVSPIYYYRDREQDLKTFTSSLTGTNNLIDLKFNWGASFAQSTSDYPYDFELDFFEPSIKDTAGMRYTPQAKTHPEQLIPAAYNNTKAAYLREADYRNQKNVDIEKSAFLNISKEYSLSDLFSGEIKAGGKYRLLSRFNNKSDLYAPYYTSAWKPYQLLPDGSIAPKDFSGSYFEAFYQRYQQDHSVNNLSLLDFLNPSPESRDVYDLYKLFPIINRDKLRQWYEINKNGVAQNGTNIEYTNDITAHQDYYDVTERVGAAYIMNTLNIGQDLVFIAGLRAENEDNDYRSSFSVGNIGGFPVPIGTVKDTSARHGETVILPNFHLNYKPYEFLNIRIAAYKALSRPDFNYRLNTSFAWRGRSTSANPEQFVGNPNLKTAQAWNFEVNTSYFGNEAGLVSLSVFYKEIKDQDHLLRQINTQGDVLFKYFNLTSRPIQGGSFQLTVPYNSPQLTKVWGFEFEHQMNFFFLPGLLKNIVLSYNASIVRSETYVIGTTIDTTYRTTPGFPIPFPVYTERVIQQKQQLENQPKFYGNISLGYDIGGFSGRISLFHQSEYNLSFTPSGRGDLVTDPFTRLDLAMKYKVTEYASVVLSVSNLTNIKEGNSIFNRVNDYKIPNIGQRYGLTADFGVKLDL